MRREENGALMLYIVIAVVVFSLLAGIMARNYSASTRATSRPDCQKAARLMAESGVRYAMSQLRTAADEATFNARVTALNGQTFTLTNGSSFTLTLTGSGTSYTVSATGNAPCLEGDPASAGLSHSFSVESLGSGIAFDNGDLSGFEVVAGAGGTNAITVHNDTTTPANSYVELGGTLFENFGALWYAGNKGDCVNGNCPLGNGVRAFFEFQFNSGSDGDGFIFALISATTNTKSTGGDTTMGELMGYAGAGTNNIGLLPPKIGLEFDIYHNDCNTNLCSPGSRCDGYNTSDSYQNSYDHLAFVHWGAETGSTVSGFCSTGKYRNRYDDNRHNAGATGSNTEPRNPAYGEPGFYTQSGGTSWLEDGGAFRLRYELTRHTTAASNGDYCYELRAWLQSTSETMPTGMDDVTKDFEATPTVQEVFYLSSAVNTQFNNFYFGWTEGTGAATQLATLRKFALDFKGDPGEPKTMPSDSPVLYLSMRDGSGTTVTDRSAYGNDGTIYSNWYTPPSVDWVPGVGCPDCPALYFSGGSSSYVTVADDSSLDLRSAGTAAAWIMLPGTPSNGATILRKGSSSTSNTEAYRLYLNNRRPSLTVRGSSGNRTITSPTALTTNRWYHLAATWNGTNLELFVDGESVATGAGVGNLDDVNGPLFLGHRTTSSGAFTGNIDEVLLYSSVLSAAKIKQLYNYGLWGRQ